MNRTHAAVGACCLVVGLAIGYGARRPAQVVTVETTKTKDESHQQLAKREETKLDTHAENVAGPVVIKWKRYPVPVPGGCPAAFAEESETTKGASTSKLDTHAAGKADLAAKADDSHQGETLSSVTVTERPKWLLGARGGASPNLDFSGKKFASASVERRIIGGIYAGLWADSRGTGGVGITWAP